MFSAVPTTTTAPTDPPAPLADQPASTELSWSDWPARDHPRCTALVLALVIAAGVVTGARLQSPACGLLAVAALLATLVNYLLPVRYAITGEGLVTGGLRGSRTLRWTRIKAARLGDEQATLLLASGGRRRRLTVRVPYGRSPRAVADALREHLLDAGVPLI